MTNGASVNPTNAVVDGDVSANRHQSKVDILGAKIEGVVNVSAGGEIPDWVKEYLK